jgi:hypothetical protein
VASDRQLNDLKPPMRAPIRAFPGGKGKIDRDHHPCHLERPDHDREPAFKGLPIPRQVQSSVLNFCAAMLRQLVAISDEQSGRDSRGWLFAKIQSLPSAGSL